MCSIHQIQIRSKLYLYNSNAHGQEAQSYDSVLTKTMIGNDHNEQWSHYLSNNSTDDGD